MMLWGLWNLYFSEFVRQVYSNGLDEHGTALRSAVFCLLCTKLSRMQNCLNVNTFITSDPFYDATESLVQDNEWENRIIR